MAFENQVSTYLKIADSCNDKAAMTAHALIALVYVARSIDQHLDELVELERERLMITTKELADDPLPCN